MATQGIGGAPSDQAGIPLAAGRDFRGSAKGHQSLREKGFLTCFALCKREIFQKLFWRISGEPFRLSTMRTAGCAYNHGTDTGTVEGCG